MRLPRALAVLLVVSCLLPAVAAAADPVRFAVGFSPEARLGRPTAMRIDLRLAPSLGVVNDVRLLTPPGLTLSDSRLGVAACRRPLLEVAEVMNPVQHRRCPANSLIGTGTATAGLLLSEEETIFGAATIELHAGASVDDKPGLLITADTYHPARMQLTYVGYLYVPPPAFGLGLAIVIPAIPKPPFGAQVALSTFHLAVGLPSITYSKIVRGRRVAYHPGGIPLPTTCPRGGFRFRAILRFADGTRRTADSVVACPRAPSRR
jgi:hypothetical protein